MLLILLKYVFEVDTYLSWVDEPHRTQNGRVLEVYPVVNP